MYPLVFFFLVAWLSFCFAKLEIQIEGAHGWAQDLPTWRLPRKHWLSRLFFVGKPATGYHLWLMVFILSMFHMAYVFVPVTIAREAVVLSFFFLFCVMEDFMWFVFNPAFGIKNFTAEKIWWHRDNWLLFMPGDYVTLSLASISLYLLSFYV